MRKDPAHYAPRGDVHWAESVLAFLAFRHDIEGLSPKYLDELAAQLDRFGQRRAFTSLDTFTQRDVEIFMSNLVQGKITGRLVTERDAEGRIIIDTTTGKPRMTRAARSMEASRNRYLAGLKSLMTWARSRTPPLTSNM